MSLPVFRVGDESAVHEFLSNSSKDELIAFLVEANARCEDLAAKNQRLRVGLERVQEVEHRMSDRLDANENRWRNQVENLIAENEKLKEEIEKLEKENDKIEKIVRQEAHAGVVDMCLPIWYGQEDIDED